MQLPEGYIYIYIIVSEPKVVAAYLIILGPAKTYILRGTPRTYAIKTLAVIDN